MIAVAPQTREKAPEVVLEGYSLELRRRPALREVDLRVPAGEVCAVTGPTGSGKSSLLRSVAGMERYSGSVTSRQGVIRIDDEEVRAGGRQQVVPPPGVVLVPAASNPFPATVFNNLAAALRGRGMTGAALRKRIGEVLELCRLGGVGASSRAVDLPFGQRRLLCLARAIALEPVLLLVDEPFEGLDPEHSGLVEGLLASMSGKRTVIVATQVVERASAIADQLVLMVDGRLIEAGSVPQLLSRPRDPRTEAYLSGRPAQY